MAEKYKVLMIDDERDIVHFLEQTFENFRHIQFFSALRAQEGVAIAKRERPEVVLLDLRMPDMNGEEALEKIRAVDPGARFLVMTGWEDGETRDRLEKIPEVAAYYTKPIDLEKIVTKVMSLIMVKDIKS